MSDVIGLVMVGDDCMTLVSSRDGSVERFIFKESDMKFIKRYDRKFLVARLELPHNGHVFIYEDGQHLTIGSWPDNDAWQAKAATLANAIYKELANEES